MPNYIKKPEPGRNISKQTIIEKVVEKPREGSSIPLDIGALANAVAQAIGKNMPKNTQIIHTYGDGADIDTFDNSGTMDKLAEQMLIERGDSKSNFYDLGNIKETKRDQKDVDDTIDLLSNLND
jgi:hypothetical protein